MKTRIKSLIDKIRYNTLWIGVASLLWLLFRSGSKPSRLRYPCQRAALLNVTTCLPLAVVPLARRLIDARHRLNRRDIARGLGVASLCLVVLTLVGTISDKWAETKALLASEALFHHAAMGVPLDGTSRNGQPTDVLSAQAQAVPDPHRVVSVHDSRATNWDYDSETMHWEYIDQGIVDTMMARGVMALTGQDTLVGAWQALIPYQPGEQVVIKMNFNNSNCNDTDQHHDGYPETVNAIVDGLVAIGVSPENIWVTDPSRSVPLRFRDRIESPDIQYYGSRMCSGVDNYHVTEPVAPNSAYASAVLCSPDETILPAQVYVDAEHIINIPSFRSHGNYVTLALKNHYGSVSFEGHTRLSEMHPFFNQGGNTEGCDLENDNILADINNNPLFREKTRLVIGDGLFGNQYTNIHPPERWDIFGDDDPNIFFFSVDPVAISSVMTDYIVAERGTQAHQQLHAGANLGLGIHEHWDSFQNKQYATIDYWIIDLDKAAQLEVSLTGEASDATIHLDWSTPGRVSV